MSRLVVRVPRTAEADAAWARLNRVLDENGGQDSPEYRQAWREWQIAVGVEPDVEAGSDHTEDGSSDILG